MADGDLEHVLAELDAEEEAETEEMRWARWSSFATQDQFCYARLVPEAEGGGDSGDDGGRCSRCRMAWYSSREAQRSHWPVHKRVCLT